MIRRLEHVGIMVKDMDQSIQFYQNTFGFQVRRRGFLNDVVELAFLYLVDQEDMEVELIAGRSMEKQEGLVNHLAFRVDHIDEEIRRLQGLGVVMDDEQPRMVLGDVKVAFFKGPNGEKLELVERA